MRRYLSLYGWMMIQFFKGQLEYPGSFIIGVVSQVFIHSAGILAIWVIMRRVPVLKGWSFDEVMLVYGLLTLSFALSVTFAPNLWQMGRYVRLGQFDRLLVRPINPLFQLLADDFDHNCLGDLAIGIALVARSTMALGLIWTPLKVVYLVLAVLSGGGIFVATYLITAVTAFWIVESGAIMYAVLRSFEFTRFPLPIFPRIIQILMTWVIPYAFASYYPASYLLGREVGWMAWAGMGIAVVMLVAGYRWWLFGLRHYTSTGS